MTYTAAALVGMAGALVVDLVVLRTRLVRRPVFWGTYPVIVFFQLLSNGVLTGRRVVRYDPDAIIGVRLVHAPVEDLCFGFALVLVTLSVWVWLGRRGVQRTPTAGRHPTGHDGRPGRPVSRADGSPPPPAPPAPRGTPAPARRGPARPAPGR